jgi:MFS family permease
VALSRSGRWLVFWSAFLGWMFAGLVMAIGTLAARTVVRSLGVEDEAEISRWFARCQAAFLLGAAGGGLLFGWLGDRFGRAKAMGWSIVWYSVWTGVTIWVETPLELLVLRAVACLGVGGMWPNGVALASEAWPNVSRPALAGVLGMSANFGLALLALLSFRWAITPENWRWVFAAGAAPVVLGVFVLAVVPESPRWLRERGAAGTKRPSAVEVLRGRLLWHTLVGIALSTVPFLGNWVGTNWAMPWADNVGGAADPTLKSWTQFLRSAGGALGSVTGGWLASLVGRRSAYFLISLASLGSSAYLFWCLTPLDDSFLVWVFVMGFSGTVYFGWLPLYLPELFPTRVRATGTGVTFNFGRIATAFAALWAGEIAHAFGGDYARIGQITCLVYVVAMLLAFAAPDTSRREMAE